MRSLVLGAGSISAALMAALGSMGQIVSRPTGRKSKSPVRSRSYWYRPTCTSSRKTRNPNDPQQAYLIARAEAKRARRAEKLTRDAASAYMRNRAHNYSPSTSLCPLYIAQ